MGGGQSKKCYRFFIVQVSRQDYTARLGNALTRDAFQIGNFILPPLIHFIYLAFSSMTEQTNRGGTRIIFTLVGTETRSSIPIGRIQWQCKPINSALRGAFCEAAIKVLCQDGSS